ncbi:MAG TPA: MoaD/ThiS family protein [Allosphingosinicella sp.]|nr:MoaD/ThiS family protein [Allosphingosinicella sp.]
MRILYFGRLRDGAAPPVEIPAEVRDTDGLRAWLGRAHPALLDAPVRIAVNETLIHGNRKLAEGDEIAFLPPMSGG